jgi:hypothetical protein
MMSLNKWNQQEVFQRLIVINYEFAFLWDYEIIYK